MSGVGSENQCDRRTKVVIIDTQYVQTDADSFKSVVQRLTGREVGSRVSVNGSQKKPDHWRNNHLKRKHNDAVEKVGGISSVLMRDLSSKELERFLIEVPFPSIDDLYQ